MVGDGERGVYYTYLLFLRAEIGLVHGREFLSVDFAAGWLGFLLAGLYVIILYDICNEVDRIW